MYDEAVRIYDEKSGKDTTDLCTNTNAIVVAFKD